MREIYAETKITNYEDLAALARNIIKPEEVRSITLKGRIDTGATCLMVPREVYQKLGLRELKEVEVTYADHRRKRSLLASVVRVEIQGRDTNTSPIIEERGEVLVGNPVIEAMDFRVDAVTGELLPRHPEFPFPIEEIL
jgi:clan AA aspartic protease